jgi:hypothetical protein
MKSYTKTYLNYFGYDTSDFIECECGCRQKAPDIHHLEARSIAKKKLNQIENLCALTRACHHRAGRDKAFNDYLKMRHRKLLLSVKTDHEIDRYVQPQNFAAQSESI